MPRSPQSFSSGVEHHVDIVVASGSIPLTTTINASLAQLVEVSDLESEGCRFESYMGHQRCSSSVVEHTLGKGEAESSILSCSTI